MMRLLAVALALGMVFPPGLMAETTVATVAPAAAAPSQARDYAQISLEELLNRDIAVAATKTRIDVAKAPVSVTVLTPEDIRRSGATDLGDLLRTIPGLDVLQAFPGHVSVSARGTNEIRSNNMLVLIDGRREEVQAAGAPFLEEAPLRLEDIKRIEVVRGPVGALYGTNALAGVISITTYSPEEVQGTTVSVVAGDRDTYVGTVRQAGKLSENWGYKIVGGYNYSSTWESMDAGTLPSNALRKGDAIALLEGKLPNDAKLALEAGFGMGELASLTTVTNQTQEYIHPHLRLAYNRAKFHAQLAYTPQWSELGERVPPVQLLGDKWSQALHLSVDRSLNPFSSSTIVVGGNLRYQRSAFTNIGTPHDQIVGSVFLQDEQSVIADRLVLFGALGVSHHPELDLQLDGNAAVVLTPIKDHNLRVSFGRGHRDPSFIENYTTFRRRVGNADAYQTGRVDIKPESVEAWELGYRGRFALGGSSRLTLTADAFREELRDLIGTRVTNNVPAGSIPQFPTATILQEFVNLETRDGEGFEVGAEFDAAAVRLVAYYSYQQFKAQATGAKIRADIPENKLSAGLRTHRGRFEFDFWVHSTSNSIDAAVNAGDQGYVLLNPRIGYKAGPWMMSVQAFNALDDKHIEAANPRAVRGETIGRMVSFNIRYTR
jgi:outer membrane receptor protein involved in Fe transport